MSNKECIYATRKEKMEKEGGESTSTKKVEKKKGREQRKTRYLGAGKIRESFPMQ